MARYGLRDEPEVVLPLARKALKHGEWENALRLVDALSADSVETSLVRLEAGLRKAAQHGDSAALRQLAADAEELCQTQPANVETHLLKASIALAQSEFEAVENALRAAIEVAQEPLPAELMLVRLYVRDQRHEEALRICEAACAREPNATSIWLARSEIHELRKQPEQARLVLEAGIGAAADPSTQRELGVQLSIFDLLHGARAAGIERLRALAAENPADVRARALLLNMPEVLTDRVSARALVDELRAIQGDTGLLWRMYQAAVLLAADDWEKQAGQAQTLLEQCVNADAGWIEPVLLLGRLRERLGQFAEAENVYRSALAVNPSAAAVTERLLRLLQAQRRFTEARQILDESRSPAGVRSALRVQILLETGEVDRAIEELRLRAAGDPTDVDARTALAKLIYEQAGDAEQAFAQLDEAEAAAGTSTTITFVRSAILEAEGRLDEARRLLDRQVEELQTFESFFMRAAFLAKIGELEAAEQDLLHVASVPERPEGPLLLGMFYADQDRLNEALAAWTRGLEEYPENQDLQRRIMTGLLARGQGDDRARGLELLAALEQVFENDADLMWVRVVILLNEGTAAAREAAEALLDRIVEVEPVAVDAHLKRMDLALERGDQLAARDMAVLAMGANPDDARVLLARAEIERALGNAEAARTMARLLLKTDPLNAAGLELLTQLALEGGTAALIDEARESLERAFKQDVVDPRMHKARLLVLEAQGQAAQAEAQLHQMCPHESEACAELWLALVELNWHLGRLEPFNQRLARAAQAAPGSPAVLEWQIRGLAAQQEYDKITALIDDGPLDALTAEVLGTAGMALAGAKQVAHRQRALMCLERSLQKTQTGSDFWFSAAGQVYQLGHAERAIELYQSLLEADPENARALNDLAWILADAKQDYEVALLLANRGLAVEPTNVHLLDTRGVILSNMPGRLEDARRDFEECAARKPADTTGRARVLLRLAAVTSDLGDQAATQKYLQEALAIDRRLDVFSTQERQRIATLQATGSSGR